MSEVNYWERWTRRRLTRRRVLSGALGAGTGLCRLHPRPVAAPAAVRLSAA